MRKFCAKGYCNRKSRDDPVVAVIYCRGGAWDVGREDCQEILRDATVASVLRDGRAAVPPAAMAKADAVTQERLAKRSRRVRARQATSALKEAAAAAAPPLAATASPTAAAAAAADVAIAAPADASLQQADGSVSPTSALFLEN